VYKIGEVPFHLIGTNGFSCKRQRMKDLLLRARFVFRSLNMTIPRRRLADDVKRGVLHVQHDYFSSFKQQNFVYL